MQIGRIRLGRRRLLAVAGLVVVTAVFVGAIPFGLDRNTAVSGVLGSVVLVVLAGLYVDQRRRHAALTSLVQQTRGAVLSQVDNVASRVEAVERSATQGAADNRTAIEETKRWMEARSQAMWDYFARGFHREPDTFVLYRIIGNDLPPRHRAGQTLTNLRFILEHEPELPHCEKRWVVNRIVDPEVEKQIIELLERHGARYLHIPFREEEYRKVGWRFNEFDPPGFTYRPEFDKLGQRQRYRALDHVYHNKNLYVMNNNGARNAALREGRTVAKWVLPWDGNCFVTRKAWDDLVDTITRQPYLKYFTVPMARVLDNDILLQPDPQVQATEEPQLVFRRDAREEFNENARYGRCPKVELFGRLGIAGPWHQWCRGPWDLPPAPLSVEAGQVGQASWVARLFSGSAAAEVDSGDRWARRIEAIWECIDSIDERIARRQFVATALMTVDESVLSRQRAWLEGGEPAVQRLVGELTALADRQIEAVEGRPESPADRIWVTALAGYLTRDERYLSAGARILREWLARQEDAATTRVAGLAHLLDGVRLLEREGALAGDDVEALRERLARLRDALKDAPTRSALDHEGTWHDVAAAAIDAYLDDVRGILATLRRSYERIGQQFLADGSQPEELASASARERCLRNLVGWYTLAHLARHVGHDLWRYRSHDGKGLISAVRWYFTSAPGDGPEPAAGEALAHQLLDVLPSDVVDAVPSSLGDPWQTPQRFADEAGLRPYWIFGTGVDRPSPSADWSRPTSSPARPYVVRPRDGQQADESAEAAAQTSQSDSDSRER